MTLVMLQQACVHLCCTCMHHKHVNKPSAGQEKSTKSNFAEPERELSIKHFIQVRKNLQDMRAINTSNPSHNDSQ